ncbi:hypothetical protein [Streptomyces sp. ODS05-4]|uniref:hypothetical protein n=1 Tax=Streptomyces sp. ODS05-4 TaxID=2944939 RepID=UPI00210D291E|nr:hypothetical protein [Streptomyces sp. ODS05-4]
MSGAQADRRWAALAREMEFTQLPELRRQAEGWRTGLTGLSALLAVLTVVKGQEQLSGLPEATGRLVMGLAGSAFGVLVAGALLSVRAAHGRPGEDILLGGQALKAWTRDEIKRVRRALRWAAGCCLAGLVLAVSATGVVWTAGEPARHLVRVATPSAEVCGELVKADGKATVVRTGDGAERKLRTVPRRELVSLTPVTAC